MKNEHKYKLPEDTNENIFAAVFANESVLFDGYFAVRAHHVVIDRFLCQTSNVIALGYFNYFTSQIPELKLGQKLCEIVEF